MQYVILDLFSHLMYISAGKTKIFQEFKKFSQGKLNLHLCTTY